MVSISAKPFWGLSTDSFVGSWPDFVKPLICFLGVYKVSASLPILFSSSKHASSVLIKWFSLNMLVGMLVQQYNLTFSCCDLTALQLHLRKLASGSLCVSVFGKYAMKQWWLSFYTVKNSFWILYLAIAPLLLILQSLKQSDLGRLLVLNSIWEWQRLFGTFNISKTWILDLCQDVIQSCGSADNSLILIA